ncbi:MAG: hypothetical protein CL678_04070 [Bdellovibrionaceae bacterium]|nr:hypothetical protein [Pseudobdellovibrionaceae bacterium]
MGVTYMAVPIKLFGQFSADAANRGAKLEQPGHGPAHWSGHILEALDNGAIINRKPKSFARIQLAVGTGGAA